MFNSTGNFTEEVAMDVKEFSVAEKVMAVIVWIVMEFICNPLLFGIVQFERLGGDPLKRRITDQVFRNKTLNVFNIDVVTYFSKLMSHFLLVTMIHTILTETINVIGFIFEIRYPNFIENAHDTASFFFMTYAILTLFEISAIKYWLKFIRKRMVVMNEAFINVSLTLINIMLSFLWALVKVILGDKSLQYMLWDSHLKIQVAGQNPQ